MTERVSPDGQMQGEGPREVNEDNVIFWNRHARELTGSIKKKAHKLLVHNCVQYVKDVLVDSDVEKPVKPNAFIVLPLNTQDNHVFRGCVFKKKPYEKDYNSSEYIVWQENKRWHCQCQGWQTAEKDEKRRNPDGVQCAHVLALFFAFSCKKFGKRFPEESKGADLYDE